MILTYTGTLLLVAVNIFLTPFLIKSLGDAEYGVYQMMASFAGYLVLMNFGTGTVMTRYVSMYLGKGDKKGERNFIAMGLIITGVLLAAIFVVSVVLYIFIDEIYASSFTPAHLAKAKQLYIIIVLNLLVTLVIQAFQGIINAYEKFLVSNVWNLIKIVLKAVLIVTLFQFKADSLVIVSVDLFLSVCFMLICIGYSAFVLKATPKLTKFDKSVFTSTAVFSLAIMLQAVVNQVNTRVDTTILGIMINPESVTMYSIAMQVFQIFSAMSTAAIALYLPKFTKMVAAGANSGDQLTSAMIPPSRIQTVISGAIMFGFFVCGRDFVQVWMGSGYEQAYIIALIVIVPMFLVYTNGVVESVLDAMQKRLVRSVVLVCSAAANIIISIVLVHYFGALGAPVGTAVTTLIGSLIILNLYYKKALGIGLRKLFFGIFRGILPSLLIATIVTLPVAVMMPVGFAGLVAKGGLFVGVLVVCLLVFGFNKDEKDMIFGMLRRRKKSN